MEPPGITRHRRPFLAPVWVALVALLIAAGVVYSLYRGATTTVVVLVSTGEKEPGTIEDPPISAEGEGRAQRLAQLFGGGAGSGRLDALYVSSERRAQQTAAPLAELTHLAPSVFSASEASATAADLLHAHEGAAVLVIADGAAVQQFLRQLTGPGEQPRTMGAPDLLYIVSVPTFGRAHLLRLKY